ncbi:MAG: DUF2505 family protein [bacterium]
MKFKIVHYFDVNTEAFEELTQDADLQEYINTLPNLAEREELERVEDDRYVRTKVRNFAVGFIPREVRHMLKPHMLSWIEESVYDKQLHKFRWKITPHFFSNVFKCYGTYTYHDESPTRMRREIIGTLTVSVPVLGGMIEKYIIGELRKNFEAEYKLTKDFIRKKLEAD